jgi:putative intracellular protease/amidase
MTKKILIIVSECGYWGEELAAPLESFDKAGYSVTFATPQGLRPIALPVSMDPTYVDPPLGRKVVSERWAKATAALEDAHNPRLDNPINLTQWFPENPYPSSPNYLRERETYFAKLDERKAEIDRRFDAILLVGGSGPLLDMANNYRLKDLIRCFYELGKPIAAECYGVTCLAFTTFSDDNGRPIIWGKHVTGHPRPYDYEEGNAFWSRQHNEYMVTRFPTVPLQLVLELAVGPNGAFHGNVGKELSVIVDYPFITGRSTGDSELTGVKLIEALEMKITRYGW